MSKKRPHSIPYKCPRCPSAQFYGILKLPNVWRLGGTKVAPCPNCNTPLVPSK